MKSVANAKMPPEKDIPKSCVVFVPLIKKKKYSRTYTFIFCGYLFMIDNIYPFTKYQFSITGDNQVTNCFPDEIIIIFIFLFFCYVTLLKVCICSSLIPSHEQDIVNFALYIKGFGPRWMLWKMLRSKI